MSPSSPQKQTFRLLKKLLFATIAVLIVFSIVEFVVASLDVAPDRDPPIVLFTRDQDQAIRSGESEFRFHPRWLWEPAPGVEMWGSVNNDDGYRGPAYPEQRGSALRIATLGDSSTFGHGFREEVCWSRRLEKKLRDSGVDAEVLNFGVIGFSAVQGHELYKGRVAHYRPDIVIAAFGAVNDHVEAPSNRSDAMKMELMATPTYRLGVILQRYATFRFLRDRLVRKDPEEVAPPKGSKARKRPERVVRVSLDEFEAALEGLNDSVREDGARLVLVSPPRRLDCEKLFERTPEYTLRLGQLARRLAIPLVDVHAGFRERDLEMIGAHLEDPKVLRYSPLFDSRVHPSKSGHDLYADMVVETLQGSQLLER